MQLVSARIWTRVAVSISYDDNHYTTGTSMVNVMAQVEFELGRCDVVVQDVSHNNTGTHSVWSEEFTFDSPDSIMKEVALK